MIVGESAEEVERGVARRHGRSVRTRRPDALGPNVGDGSRNPDKHARLTGFTVLTQEQFELIEFLRRLCDSSMVKNENFSDPWLR